VPPERASEFSRRATDIFASLTKTAVTEEELAAAKASLTSEYEAEPIIEHLREMEAYNLPRNHALNFATRVNAVTAADVQRVAFRLLESNALTVVVLGRVSNHPKSQMQDK
jgi:zinc protease